MSGLRKGKRDAQKTMSSGFPMLTSDELRMCLEALNVTIGPDDLSKPTPHSTQMIWYGLLRELCSVDTDMFERPKYALLSQMEYKDVYTDPLAFLMFYRHCRNLAEICNVPRFSPTDLTRPEPTRLRLVLSGIMNFAKFREQYWGVFLARQEMAVGEKERLIELQQKHDKLEADIQEIKARNEAQAPMAAEAKAKNEALHRELMQLSKEQVDQSQQAAELKAERERLITEARDQLREHELLQQRILDTRARLVRSPERVKRNINELQAQVARQRADVAAIQAKVLEHSKRHEVIVSLEGDLKRIVEVQREIEVQRAKLAKAQGDKAALVQALEAGKVRLDNLAERTNQLARQIKLTEDRLATSVAMREEQQQRAKAKVEQLSKEYVTRKKERTIQDRERQRLLNEQAEIEAQMAQYIHEREAELNALILEHSEMRRLAGDFMTEMAEKLALTVKAE